MKLIKIALSIIFLTCIRIAYAQSVGQWAALGWALEAEKKKKNETMIIYGLVGLAIIVIIILLWRIGNKSNQVSGIRNNSPATNLESTEIKKGVENISETRQCPFCAETIKAAAKMCRFCKSEVEPVVTKTNNNINLDPALTNNKLISDHINSDLYKSENKKVYDFSFKILNYLGVIIIVLGLLLFFYRS
jgi:hypothetical protein